MSRTALSTIGATALTVSAEAIRRASNLKGNAFNMGENSMEVAA